MSFGHFDEVYDICCELCVRSDEGKESMLWSDTKIGKEVKPIAVFGQDFSEEELYEKV